MSKKSGKTSGKELKHFQDFTRTIAMCEKEIHNVDKPPPQDKDDVIRDELTHRLENISDLRTLEGNHLSRV